MCRLRGWEEDTPFSKVFQGVDYKLLLKKGRIFEGEESFWTILSFGFSRFKLLLFNFYCFYPKRQTRIFGEEEGKRREEEVSRG